MPVTKAPPIDLRKVIVRKRNMLDPVATRDWDSYFLELRTLAENILTQVSNAAIAQRFPKYLKMQPHDDEPGAFLAFPVGEEGPDTVPVKYLESAQVVRIDCSRFFMVMDFHMPRDLRAYVPVSRHDSPEGPSLILHFGQAQFRSVPPRKRKGARPAAAHQVVAAPNPDSK